MKQIKIICVDDEPEILQICKELLESEGYAVRCASNGPQAIELFRKERADIVVTDVRMPGMDGLDVLRAIKDIDALTEVIILTGHASIDNAVSALKNGGAFDFLTKPLHELDDLLRTIEKAHAHRSLRLENALLVEELSRNQVHLVKRNRELGHTQKELELSRQRYRDLYDHAPIGYLAINKDGAIIEANQTSAKLFDIPAEDLRNMLFIDFVPSSERAAYESFCTHMGSTSSSVCELPLTKVDGTRFYAHIEGVAILDSQGQPHQFRITVSDITSQKEIELALQESEQRYRTLVETIPHGIQEIDTNGTITFANARHAALHGYSVDELVGQSVAGLASSKAEGRRLLGHLKALTRLQPPPQTWLGQDRTQDGRIIDIKVDWDYKRNADGDVVGFVSVLSDITKQKKAETALRESELRYRSFVENFNGIAFRLTPNGRPIFYHGAVKTISGYSEEDLVASNPSWEELIHPEELSLVRMRRKRICLPGENSIAQEYRIRHRNGRWRWVREHTQNTHSTDDQSNAVQGVLFDITDYKNLQNKYFESRKLDAIATLAGGVAHQFNNALAGLMGNVELLEMDEKIKGTDVNKYTQNMITTIQKMSQLTSQLLAYARGGKYLPTEIHLSDLIRQSINLLHHRLNSELEIEIELTSDNDWIRADIAQLQMVFLAVMDNAMEAASQKGRIVIRTQPFLSPDDAIPSNPDRAPGDHICLTIQDEGCGMDAQTQGKIFEPFFTTKFVGRGLGLSAAYGIVANHNGWMEVNSAPGKGTTISIYLPTVTPKKTQLQKEHGLQPSHGDATILVVEDDPMVMKAVRRLLKKLHYRVIEAVDGNMAIEMLQTFSNQIDAVLLDIRLPDMDADEVYAEMLTIRSDIRVIACSGYDKDGPAEALLDAGALGFLQKPFSIKTLSAKLRKVLALSDQAPKTINIGDSGNSDPQKERHLKLV